MVFGCLKSSSHSHPWTPNSFPGGNPYSSSMLFGPVTGSPYMAAVPGTIPAYGGPMIVPIQTSAPVVLQQPSPAIQVLPVIQVTPSPAVTALPPVHDHTILQTPQPASHVPSPVIRSSIPVPQPSPPQVVQSICHDHRIASTPAGVLFSTPSQHQDQQHQGSSGPFTVNLYVNTPEHRSSVLDDRSPSPTSQLQLLEQQQQWQQQQQERQQLWQHQQQEQQEQWQERQQEQLQQWYQHQLQQRGRSQSARPPTAQPPTPSSLNINIVGPQPRRPGSTYVTSPFR